jgi:hypothetical protein
MNLKKLEVSDGITETRPLGGAALDHLTIAALTLEQGVDHVRRYLGIVVPSGGRHPLVAHLNVSHEPLQFEFLSSSKMRNTSSECANAPPALTAAATNAASAISSLLAPCARACRVWVSMQ